MTSKFYEKYQQSLKTSELKRVKVTYLNGFEGFVLEENENGAIIYVVSAPEDQEYENSLVSLDPGEYEDAVEQDDVCPLDIVKQHSIRYLMDKGLLSCETQQLVEELLSAPCVNGVETILRSCGLVDTEILDIFKAALL
jgi:hypothetical protein